MLVATLTHHRRPRAPPPLLPGSAQDSCSDSDNCVWCLSAAVPSACYTTEEAKRLPAAVFQCKVGGVGVALG